ncbi:MAG: type III-A CRISPR-associated RAMP protein Csm4 [Armatimonadetes bacterium]|nr:type III-A CRISPR-associated RAMP protein Csm4 [Armatimonadota bacterium]CUU34970.1 CRISPR-associated protein Csm4 [Armatimonadetes bacterium DC]
MMQGAAVYELHFRAPLHIGERGIGQEETRDFVPADTLFSALCTLWAFLHGESALNELLARYRDEGREPFFLTSAFPFAGEIRFYPKPLRPPDTSLEFAKRWKSIRWVSERVFQAYLNGEPIRLEAESQQPPGESRRLLLQDGKILIHPDDWQALQAFWNYEADDLRIYEVATVPRVTLDRISNASQIWLFSEVHFTQGCGLWFGTVFGETGYQQPFEACLRLLGDTGLGGERNAGRGLFNFERREWTLHSPSTASRFVTLSPWLPANTEQLGWLRAEGSAYELTLKRGWLGSPHASNLRRKEVWMIGEGSVIAHPPEFRAGQLVNLQPDGASHPAYRYGYAFPVGVK